MTALNEFEPSVWLEHDNPPTRDDIRTAHARWCAARAEWLTRHARVQRGSTFVEEQELTRVLAEHGYDTTRDEREEC